MSVFDDAWDWSKTAVSDVVDAVPGSSWAKQAVTNTANALAGPLKDFANLSVCSTGTNGEKTCVALGPLVMTAVASYLYLPLAQTTIPLSSGMLAVGPQLASVVFAIPALAGGDKDFVNAWTTGFVQRLAGVIREAGGDSAVGQQMMGQANALITDAGLQQLVATAKAQIGPNLSTLTETALRQWGLSADQVAAKYKVRPDVAAAAVDALFHLVLYKIGDPALGPSDFDLQGNRIAAPAAPTGPAARVQPNPVLLRTVAAPLAASTNVLDQIAADTLNGAADAVQQGQPLTQDQVQAVANVLASAGQPAAADALINPGVLAGTSGPGFLQNVLRPTTAFAIRGGPAVAPVPHTLLGQIASLALLTSPVWVPFWAVPRLRAHFRKMR